MKPAVCGQAGIVDDNVESAEQLGGGGDHRLGICRVGNAATRIAGSPSGSPYLLRGSAGQVGMAVVDGLPCNLPRRGAKRWPIRCLARHR